MQNFSPSNTDFRINGGEITDWGQTAQPLLIEPIDAMGTLIRGQSKGSVRLDNDNHGWRVTVNLLPGSPNSAYLNGLRIAKSNLTFSHTVISTLEAAAGSEGMIVNMGQIGRAGNSAVTDDQFIMEFTVADLSTGGDA
ncbi:virion structural protein [Vibrio phage K367 g1]|nr:putative tail tube protein [Vibrio phage 511E55-1]